MISIIPAKHPEQPHILKKPKRNNKTGEMEGEYTRIWTAVDRDRFNTVSFRVGNGDKKNYIDIAMEIESKYKEIAYMCTDSH